MAKTKEDKIKTVYGGSGHVVILGTGASIASTLNNPEPNGKRLPSMDNFVDLVSNDKSKNQIDFGQAISLRIQCVIDHYSKFLNSHIMVIIEPKPLTLYLS